MRYLTIEISKWWQKCGFPCSDFVGFLIHVLDIPDNAKTEIKPVFTIYLFKVRADFQLYLLVYCVSHSTDPFVTDPLFLELAHSFFL